MPGLTELTLMLPLNHAAMRSVAGDFPSVPGSSTNIASPFNVPYIETK